jgi:hypothetical protein
MAERLSVFETVKKAPFAPGNQTKKMLPIRQKFGSKSKKVQIENARCRKIAGCSLFSNEGP